MNDIVRRLRNIRNEVSVPCEISKDLTAWSPAKLQQLGDEAADIIENLLSEVENKQSPMTPQ